MWLFGVTTAPTVNGWTCRSYQHFTQRDPQPGTEYIYLSSAGLRGGRERRVKRKSSVYRCTFSCSAINQQKWIGNQSVYKNQSTAKLCESKKAHIVTFGDSTSYLLYKFVFTGKSMLAVEYIPCKKKHKKKTIQYVHMDVLTPLILKSSNRKSCFLLLWLRCLCFTILSKLWVRMS